MGGTVTQTFTTGLPAGTYPNVAGNGTVTVDSGGRATVTVPGKSAVAIHTGSTPQPNDKEAPVYYKTGWTTANIHYGINGTWTTVPGVPMETACTGWKKKTITLGSATSFKTTFNNGNDYTLGTGISTVKDGVITANATSPCSRSGSKGVWVYASVAEHALC